MRRLFLVASAILTWSALGADNPLAGVWKLNTAKSHFSHGDLPVSLVLTIEADGANGIKYSSKNQLVNGTRGGASYAAKFDGKDYEVTGTPSYDHVSIKRVGPRVFRVLMKKGDAVIVDTNYVVAADGKSLTRKGKHAPPEVNEFDEWFDRQ